MCNSPAFKPVEFKLPELELELNNPKTLNRGSQLSPLGELVETSRSDILLRADPQTQPQTYKTGDLVRFFDDDENELNSPWKVIELDARSGLLVLTHPSFVEGTKIKRPISDVIAKVDSHSTNSQELYEQLIAPIEEFLPSNPEEHVIFIPQGELFLIPFAALKDKEGKYLIEKHAIGTAPAIQVLDLTSKLLYEQRNGTSALVVGNPTMPIIPLTDPPVKLTPLPAAEEEAKQIAQLLNTQPILGEDATAELIKERMSTVKYIHLATHGLLSDIKQLGTPGAIALAPTSDDDGFLTSGDIIKLKLKADLVVLSACNTGKGKITGDGIVGLSRSFINAGVPSALVSLWNVPDSPTAELMTEFYQNYLQKGMNKARALRQAMLTMKDKYPSPVDWAAFTLIGEAE